MVNSWTEIQILMLTPLPFTGASSWARFKSIRGFVRSTILWQVTHNNALCCSAGIGIGTQEYWAIEKWSWQYKNYYQALTLFVFSLIILCLSFFNIVIFLVAFTGLLFCTASHQWKDFLQSTGPYNPISAQPRQVLPNHGVVAARYLISGNDFSFRLGSESVRYPHYPVVARGMRSSLPTTSRLVSI